jgi:uncharacterized Tic20 family protein
MSVPPNEVPPNDVVTPPPAPAGTPSAEEKQWAMFTHLSALLGGILTGHMFGWGCFIGPLIIWLVKKDTMPFVNDQGKEALNFNITLAIVGLALIVVSIITIGIGLLITIPVGIIVGIGWLVFTIIAAIKASEGVVYRYPINLRLVK